MVTGHFVPPVSPPTPRCRFVPRVLYPATAPIRCRPLHLVTASGLIHYVILGYDYISQAILHASMSIYASEIKTNNK